MTEIARERLSGLRPRSRRRALVVVFGTLVAVTTAVGLLGAAQQAAWIGVAAFAAGVLLHAATRMVAQLDDERLDERLVSERNAATARAYWILAVVVFVTPLLLLIMPSDFAVLASESERDVSTLYTICIEFFLVAAFTPAAVLAWRQTEV